MGLGIWALAASSLFSGFSSLQSSNTQALWQETEGKMAKADADRRANIALDEGYRTEQQQAMQFIGAGVELQGTPLLVLKETRYKTELEAESIRTTGRNMNILAKQKASITRNEGRSAMISSLFQTMGYGLSARGR